MGSFEKCMPITEAWEGGWSDHAADPGGKTKYGITQATLSEDLGRPATVDEIRNLTKEHARRIYRKKYWDRISGDRLPAGIDLCVFDFGVNSGPDRAVRSLQTAIGVKADGWVGEKTLDALVGLDHAALVRDLCDRRLAFLQQLKTWKTFGKGWGNRVRDIRARAAKMVQGVSAGQPQFIASAMDSAKALPEAPVEKSVSTDQKAGLLGGFGVLGMIAAFYRENADLLTDPTFLLAMAVGGGLVIYLATRKPKLIEQLQ